MHYAENRVEWVVQEHYPHYMVPMLELEDGTQIGEALAIWTYLEALHPQPALMGRTALEKATISSWERRAYDEGLIGHAEIFRNSHPNFVDRGLPGYHAKVPQIPALIERGKMRVAHFYQKFNNQLADNKFVVGERSRSLTLPRSSRSILVWPSICQSRGPPACPALVRRDAEAAQRSREVTKHAPDGTPLPVAA